jgi:hypothetical protein
MGRIPNTVCSNCGDPTYQRPSDQAKYRRAFCSRACFAEGKRLHYAQDCLLCGKSFECNSWEKRRYCSRECANVARTGTKYSKDGSSSSRRLIALLRRAKTACCMIKGCSYFRTLDTHRLTAAKDGGKYEPGNEFAICPDQHAEIHRGVIRVEQTGEFELTVVEQLASSQLSKYGELPEPGLTDWF